MRTALVTDSASCLPAEVRQRYDIRVAQLTVTLNDKPGDDSSFDREEFYAALAAGDKPTTSQPSPGALLKHYREAAKAGAEAILSIHIDGNVSGTVGSARIAAGSSPIPVHVVDCGATSFQEGLCVWEAAEALASGRSMEQAGEIAVKAGRSSGNVFIVGALKFAREGGRLRQTEVAGVPVLTIDERGIVAIGSATSVEEALDLMTKHVAAAAAALSGQRLRAGVTHIHAAQIAAKFKERLSEIEEIEELMDYELVPSMAAHSGPGTVSTVFLPRPVR